MDHVQVQEQDQEQERDQELEQDQVLGHVQVQEQSRGLERDQVLGHVQVQEQGQGLEQDQIQEKNRVLGKGHPPNPVIKGAALPQRSNLNAHGAVVEVPLVVTKVGRLRPETVNVVRRVEAANPITGLHGVHLAVQLEEAEEGVVEVVAAVAGDN